MKLFRITTKKIGLSYGNTNKPFYIISENEDKAVARLRMHLVKGRGIDNDSLPGWS